MTDQLAIIASAVIVAGLIIWIVIRTPPEEAGPPVAIEGNPPTRTEVAQPLPSSSHDDGWTKIGWLMLIAGILGFLFSLAMKTSVESYTPPSILGVGGSSSVVNLDLLFHKGVAIAGSLTAIGIGVFCVAVGAILKSIATSKGGANE